MVSLKLQSGCDEGIVRSGGKRLRDSCFPQVSCFFEIKVKEIMKGMKSVKTTMRQAEAYHTHSRSPRSSCVCTPDCWRQSLLLYQLSTFCSQWGRGGLLAWISGWTGPGPQ
jgi:hypothetical protein